MKLENLGRLFCLCSYTFDLLVHLLDCLAIPSLDTDLPTSGGPGRVRETKAGMTFNL